MQYEFGFPKVEVHRTRVKEDPPEQGPVTLQYEFDFSTIENEDTDYDDR